MIIVTLLAMAGCSRPAPGSTPPATAGLPPTSSTPTTGASGTPTASPSDLNEFTVDGIGPYQLGVSLATLQADASLDQVTSGAPPCPEATTARGIGAWTEVELRFRKDGTLYLAINTSPSIPTPSGAWLGTRLADLKKIYAAISAQQLTHGTATAFLATTLSGRGILFDLGPGQAVTAMTAGDASYLRATYLAGAAFC